MTRRWLADRRRFAVATLIETVGSAPLDPGAVMLIADDGAIEGSVTGGCVEGALVEEARDVLGGAEPRVRTYGISDDEAAGVGLMCGGTVRVFVDEPDEQSSAVVDRTLAAVQEGRPAAIATLLDGPRAGSRMALVDGELVGGFGATELLDRTVGRDLRGSLDQALTGIRRYGADGAAMGSDLRVYFQAYSSPPSMVIFGAIDFAVATARLAGELGYRVTIVDAREPFIKSPRFEAVAEVVVDWPDRYLETRQLSDRDVVLVFTHDPKFDQPALTAALASGAGYVGALGSRRTHRNRVERLREAGVPEADIDRIAAPCGLDLGARTPAQTAVSILAEIIAEQNRRSGERLSETSGTIHDRPAAELQPAE
ncbi:MAG TPA: XdhC/CoxI family protein [Solirubrobacterales bacterium]|nr:XdhC/CoxI family protein [Solirubrobacterales bacterium]